VVTADRSPQEAGPVPGDVVEGPHHIEEGDPPRWTGQGKAAKLASAGLEDTRPRQQVEGLGQVVLRNAELRSQAGGADRLIGALRDGEDCTERVLSGLG
jgi:hypothetical protein